MKEKIFGTINCTNNPKNDFYLFQKMYSYINKRFNKFYYINLSRIFYPKKKIIKSKYPKNFIVYTPSNYVEFKDFLKNKDLYTFISLGKKFKYIYIFYLLKKYPIIDPKIEPKILVKRSNNSKFL